MLDVLTVGSPDPEITELILAARAHMAFEEQQALPALRKVTSRPGAWMLGIKFAMAKKVTPTRPHPYGPDRRFGLVTKGALTAALDHLRDQLTSRDASWSSPKAGATALEGRNVSEGDHAASHADEVDRRGGI